MLRCERDDACLALREHRVVALNVIKQQGQLIDAHHRIEQGELGLQPAPIRAARRVIECMG